MGTVSRQSVGFENIRAYVGDVQEKQSGGAEVVFIAVDADDDARREVEDFMEILDYHEYLHPVDIIWEKVVIQSDIDIRQHEA